MQVQIFAAHWGHHALSPEAFIGQVKAAGFDGIEMSLPLDVAAREDWTGRIAAAGLQLIVGQWETALVADFAGHRAALETLLHNACAARPLHVNSQTGKDYFTVEQNRELLELAESIARQHGVPIYHETHRSRWSAHPALALPYLRQLPDLLLTADLSHWCCACESLLADQPQTLAETLPRVRHIHARVGHEQGPQVADFRAPEAQAALQAHLAWWDEVIRLRRAAGAERITLTPEFGPVPYTPTLPYTQAEISNAWQLNVAMLALLRQRYA